MGDTPNNNCPDPLASGIYLGPKLFWLSWPSPGGHPDISFTPCQTLDATKYPYCYHCISVAREVALLSVQHLQVLPARVQRLCTALDLNSSDCMSDHLPLTSEASYHRWSPCLASVSLQHI